VIRGLLRLYPRAWRERYGDEFAALITAEGLRPRVLLDVLRSALGERLIWGTPGMLRNLRNIVGSYCVIHTVAWMFHRVIGTPVESADWWTRDAFVMSAVIQARAAAIACALGFGVLWAFSGQSRATRTMVQSWIGLTIAIGVGIAEGLLSTAGVTPTRATAELMFGTGGQILLIVGPMVAASEVVRVFGYRRLNPDAPVGLLL
jgi:hypothetical protein